MTPIFRELRIVFVFFIRSATLLCQNTIINPIPRTMSTNNEKYRRINNGQTASARSSRRLRPKRIAANKTSSIQVNIESKAAAAVVVPKRNQVVDPLLNNSLLNNSSAKSTAKSSAKSTARSSAKSSAKSTAKSSTKSSSANSSFDSCYDCIPLTQEQHRRLAEIQKDFESNHLTKIEPCGFKGKKGHATKIGVNGSTFSPDGMKLLKAGGIPSTEQRVRTQTLGMLINSYDPKNSTGLQTSRLSKLTGKRYIKQLREWMASVRPDFKFTSIQVNVNTTSAPHVVMVVTLVQASLSVLVTMPVVALSFGHPMIAKIRP